MIESATAIVALGDAIMEPEPSQTGLSRWAVVVIVLVLVILVGLAIPGVSKVREAAARTQDTNNLKQMAIGVQDLASGLDSQLPPSVGRFQGKDGTFFFHIQPYIEADNIWKNNRTQVRILTYYSACDSSIQEGRPWTSFASNVAVFGERPETFTRLPLDFGEKGTAQTIIVLPRFAVASGIVHAWGDTSDNATYLEGPITFIEHGVPPTQARNDTVHAMSSSGAQVALADGSARTISPQVRVETFRWACNPKGDRRPPSDW
jgi:hypothetical protein